MRQRGSSLQTTAKLVANIVHVFFFSLDLGMITDAGSIGDKAGVDYIMSGSWAGVTSMHFQHITWKNMFQLHIENIRLLRAVTFDN